MQAPLEIIMLPMRLLNPLPQRHPTPTHAFDAASIPRRLHQLIQNYLSVHILNDRLQDLPLQFQHPQPRPWQPIDWGKIDPGQIQGIDPLIFLTILAGCIDTEVPIRGYTQTSRQYLDPLYPLMARSAGLHSIPKRLSSAAPGLSSGD